MSPRRGCTSIPSRARSASCRRWRLRRPACPCSSRARSRRCWTIPDTDVIHFHNISLVGGPGLLGLGAESQGSPDHDGSRALADLSDAPALEIRPQAVRRADLRELLPEGRPAAAGLAATGAIERGLRHLDALLFPSRHSLEEHRRRGLGAHVPLVQLPYFLPDGWSHGIEDEPPLVLDRPYLAAAGRLVKMKGFQRLIPLMRYLPEVDLRIAGTGPHEARAACSRCRVCRTCGSRDCWAAGRWPGCSAAPRGRGSFAFSRDLRLRGARGVRGGDAGRRP